MKNRSIIVVSLLSLFLTGCVGFHPISSKPPGSAIVIKSPFTVHSALLDNATFPAGEYRPLFEDDGGFYFQAPEEVVVHAAGIATYTHIGGLYVERGAIQPTRWYYIYERDGHKKMWRFHDVPQFDLVP